MNNLRKQDLFGLVLYAVVFVVLYVLFDQEILDNYWETNVVMMIINIILAVSLNLINGFTGQFSIGHAGFMAVGAYVSAIFTVKLELTDGEVETLLAGGKLRFYKAQLH